MAFGRKVHDDIDLVFPKDAGDRGDIANISLDEPVVGIILDLTQRCEIACVSELVDIGHAMSRIGA